MIRYQLPVGNYVNLTVYDILGRFVAELVNGRRMPGYHEVTLDASHLASGVYLYKIQAGEFNSIRKMVLIK